MANLHDLSWGNRPTAAAGTDALADNAKKQQELKNNYMVFRVNFLTFWIIMNTLYAMVVENYAQYSNRSGDGEAIIVNNGTIGFLEVFACYLAALVLYKTFFGVQHIVKFKILSNCFKAYKMPRYDLHQEVKRLRAETVDWNVSKDDREN
jgi:hypothetical protein